MPLFVLHCTDKPGALDLRLSSRPDHVAWLKGPAADALKVAGPYLGEDGAMMGSMLVIEAADLAAAKALAADDPYAKAGLFADVQIRQWNHVLGAL